MCVPIAILSSHSTPARPHCFFLHNQKLQTVLRGPPCSPLAFISLMPIVQCIKTSVGGEVGSRVGNSRIVYVHICEEISLPLQVWFDTTIYALHAGGDGGVVVGKNGCSHARNTRNINLTILLTRPFPDGIMNRCKKCNTQTWGRSGYQQQSPGTDIITTGRDAIERTIHFINPVVIRDDTFSVRNL